MAWSEVSWIELELGGQLPQLSGAASASFVATGELSTSSGLSGTANATFTATAELDTLQLKAKVTWVELSAKSFPAVLSGEAIATFSGAGDLLTSASMLGGEAIATFNASAELLTSMPLAGSADAIFSGAGELLTAPPARNLSASHQVAIFPQVVVADRQDNTDLQPGSYPFGHVSRDRYPAPNATLDLDFVRNRKAVLGKGYNNVPDMVLVGGDRYELPIAPWFNPNAGTLFIEFGHRTFTKVEGNVALTGPGLPSAGIFGIWGSDLIMDARGNGENWVVMGPSGIDANSLGVRVALGSGQGATYYYVAGTLVFEGPSTVGTTWAGFTRLMIRTDTMPAVRRLRYYPRRLSKSELSAITL